MATCLQQPLPAAAIGMRFRACRVGPHTAPACCRVAAACPVPSFWSMAHLLFGECVVLSQAVCLMLLMTVRSRQTSPAGLQHALLTASSAAAASSWVPFCRQLTQQWSLAPAAGCQALGECTRCTLWRRALLQLCRRLPGGPWLGVAGQARKCCGCTASLCCQDVMCVKVLIAARSNSSTAWHEQDACTTMQQCLTGQTSSTRLHDRDSFGG